MLVLGVKKKYPDAHAANHAAFANSVAYAVTGASGGYGGPSMREHWASRIVNANGGKGGGNYDLEEACELLKENAYGPLTIGHARMLSMEHCFDDAPGEVEEAQKLLQEEK